MSATLTNSLAFLNKIKSQYDSNRDTQNQKEATNLKESDVSDPRNYGSIKRSHASNINNIKYQQGPPAFSKVSKSGD